jgi:hypothetical protein
MSTCELEFLDDWCAMVLIDHDAGRRCAEPTRGIAHVGKAHNPRIGGCNRPVERSGAVHVLRRIPGKVTIVVL